MYLSDKGSLSLTLVPDIEGAIYRQALYKFIYKQDYVKFIVQEKETLILRNSQTCLYSEGPCTSLMLTATGLKFVIIWGLRVMILFLARKMV